MHQTCVYGVGGGNDEYHVGAFPSQRVASKERGSWKCQILAGASSIWELTREPFEGNWETKKRNAMLFGIEGWVLSRFRRWFTESTSGNPEVD